MWRVYRQMDRRTTDNRRSEKLTWAFRSGELKSENTLSTFKVSFLKTCKNVSFLRTHRTILTKISHNTYSDKRNQMNSYISQLQIKWTVTFLYERSWVDIKIVTLKLISRTIRQGTRIWTKLSTKDLWMTEIQVCLKKGTYMYMDAYIFSGNILQHIKS